MRPLMLASNGTATPEEEIRRAEVPPRGPVPAAPGRARSSPRRRRAPHSRPAPLTPRRTWVCPQREFCELLHGEIMRVETFFMSKEVHPRPPTPPESREPAPRRCTANSPQGPPLARGLTPPPLAAGVARAIPLPHLHTPRPARRRRVRGPSACLAAPRRLARFSPAPPPRRRAAPRPARRRLSGRGGAPRGRAADGRAGIPGAGGENAGAPAGGE